MPWYVYILECADGTLYTGVTTDVARRVREHNESDRGAKYTRSRRPVTLFHTETFEGKEDAMRREYFIKVLTRKEKIKLIKSL